MSTLTRAAASRRNAKLQIDISKVKDLTPDELFNHEFSVCLHSATDLNTLNEILEKTYPDIAYKGNLATDSWGYPDALYYDCSNRRFDYWAHIIGANFDIDTLKEFLSNYCEYCGESEKYCTCNKAEENSITAYDVKGI